MDPRTRYLLARALGLAATANALRPAIRFSRVPTPVEFLTGLPVSELPLHNAAIQGGLALLGARGGRARGWRGVAGAGLTAVSLAGLWRLHRDAQDAEHVLEAALADGLGPGYLDDISEPFNPAPARPLDRRSIIVPRVPRRRRYTATGSDVPYGEAGRRNHLDIWKRADLPHDAGAPVLLQVHGGAWVIGQKEGQGYPLMAHLAERGWVCVAINYRLSPRATWPDHIVDVKRAIAWVRANIADHGGDPDFLAISGGSAGGHLSSLAALTPGDATYQPGFEDADTSVAAAVPFYGVYDFTYRHGVGVPGLEPLLARRVFKTQLADDRDSWDRASPVSRVTPDAPPFFVLHGTNDTVVPVEQAELFVSMLSEVSRQPVVYAELPRAQHAFDVMPSVRAHHTVHAVERFLAVVRSRQGGPTPAEAVEGDEPVEVDRA
ncbi:MAG: alpha/beta hydrolase [Acidimicrobiales bacterium]|nr:alpha/beta hydrolase [Acidimicrobiales bacterium]